MAQNQTKTHQDIRFKQWVDDNDWDDPDTKAAAEAVARLYSEDILRDAAKPTGSMEDFEMVLREQFQGKFPGADWYEVTSAIDDWYNQ